MMSASFGDLAVFSKTAPPSLAVKPALRGIFTDTGKSKSAPADAGDLSIGSRFQVADGLEAVRRGLQRLVDIGRAMCQGQEHIVLGMKERAVA